MSISVQFLGGAGTVTGSKFLVETDAQRILIDCGLFQGVKDLRLKNWEPFSVNPQSIDAVILTHAHLDHTGYLPLLVKKGFRGKIFCTPPTRDLTKVILADAAHLQEEDADYANRKGFSKHKPAKPLFTTEDAEKALGRLTTIHDEQWRSLQSKTRFRFRPSGHILGSAIIELETSGKKFVFSGDLGRENPLLLNPPDAIKSADYLFVESTYGDRLHDSTSVLRALAKITQDTIGRGGFLLIPSFAVGRTQDLLYLFSKLKKQKKMPDVPVFLDSPMGINATQIFLDHSNWHKLSEREVNDLADVATMVKSRKQSKELLTRKHPAVVVAGSGMISGGRILHHLEARLSDSRNTVLLVGFQAAGTRGRLLRGGITELKMHGRYIPVRAHIEEISTLSAHADQGEILGWLRKFEKPPKMTFIVHGEPQASDALRVKIQDTLDWKVKVPAGGEIVSLE